VSEVFLPKIIKTTADLSSSYDR